MKLDAAIPLDRLGAVPRYARAVEEIGFDGLWTQETAHNPFLPLALAAEHTERIDLGTAIAVAFPRSPTVLAQIAWDLAEQSGGRFILGLGTQVKAHIERRFGVPWDHPTPRLRDMILAMRALWHTWQSGARLNYRGEFYQLTLMTPFFSPTPIAHPRIPVYIAGVNKHLCYLAGELCDGFHVHPFHSAEYIRQAVLPNIDAGAAAAGRSRADVAMVSSVFVLPTDNDAEFRNTREAVKQQIAFYASTPTYRVVLATHGWESVGEDLSRLASRQRWAEMPALITDAMLDVYAVQGPWADLPALIRRRYTGLLDRVTYYIPFEPGVDTDRWRQAVAGFHTPHPSP